MLSRAAPTLTRDEQEESLMPRHLITCVDILHGWGPPASPREQALAADYMRASSGWYELGLEISATSRERVMELWKDRPEQRELLEPLVYGYPCEEFKRPFYRHAERGGWGNFRAWFRYDPSLRGYLHRFVVQRALDTSDRGRALDASVLWARHFGGGIDAWRAAANATGGARGRESWWEDVLVDRHYLTPVEYQRLFYCRHEKSWEGRHLIYPDLAIDQDLTIARRPLGLLLRKAAVAGHRFAQEAWSSDDEERYALALAILEQNQRRGWRPSLPVLKRIDRLANELAT